MTDRSVRRFARRLPYILALGFAPVFALAWGCGDDDTASTAGARVNVDPGGTWGAEVVVTVVGRGRILSTTPGIDCPSGSCFAKFVFTNNAADGATGGVQLTASPTTGAKFLGWTFEGVSIGARGRGSDSCNPITRASTTPSGITTEVTISLPYGETEGSAPAGKDCAGFTKVPLVYKVTAKFDEELPPVDAGFDAGADDIVYEAPDVGGTQAGGVGLTTSGSLYWKYRSGGSDVIAYGPNPNSPVQGTAIKVTTVPNAQSFRVMRNGVIYTDGQSVFAIRSSSPTSPTSVGTMATVGTCLGFAIDSSSNVYCRTQTTIVRWPFSGLSYGTPVVLFGSGLPSTGSDLAVDSSSGPIYIDTGSGISSLALFAPTPDGGAASPSSVITGRADLENLRSGTFGFAWTELGTGVYTTSSKNPGTSVSESTASTGTVSTLEQDQGNSTSWIAAGTSGIFLAPAGGTATAFRTGSQFTSAAASSQYIFWTTSFDARIHRARRSGF